MPEEPRHSDDDRLMRLVEDALSRPPGERESFLREACGADTVTFDAAWTYVQREQRMQGFLLAPLIPGGRGEKGLQAGDLLQGRFRIVREVAHGGMGVVYEARDEKLDRRIAIKCAKPGFRKRLPPEVRNASDVSHRNVCKIFEIHTAIRDGEEFDFITMEFLDGETLAQRMNRGPVAPEEAQSIGRQIAEGLAEAHRNQVVHGDLKSGNVILAPGADGEMRVVITDFGLASRSGSAPRSGEVAGTPDYMAPELLRGGPVSKASDVYALGLILYRLAAGRTPFESGATLEERSERRAPPLKHPWHRVIERCLDPDAARRFQSGEEVAAALSPRRTRRRLLAASAVLIAAVSYVVATQRAAAPRESVRLAVLPFQAPAEVAQTAAALTRDTAAQVARLKGNSRTKLSIVPNAGAATHVLQGSLRQEKDQLVLQAYLTDTRSRANAREWKAGYGAGEIRFAPAALAGLVTATLRLPPLAAPATVNDAARPDYDSGLGYVRLDSKVDAALEHLERAAGADPDSPLTHAALAEAQWFKYFLTRNGDWWKRAAESVERAERRNPDLAAVHRMAGVLEENAGRYEAAIVRYRRAIELEPGEGDGYRRLGSAHEKNNQFEEALTAYRRAVEAGPGYYRNHQALGTIWIKRSNSAEAARHFEKAVELAPAEPAPRRALATAYSESGRFADAENQLRHSLDLEETPTAWHTLGVVLMHQGKDQEAIECMTRVLRRWPERSLWWRNLGIAYRRVNRAGLSRQANLRGLAAAEREMVRDPRNGRIRSDLAYLCARLGDGQRAESEIAQALQLSPNDSETRCNAALTYEALGRRDDALEVLKDVPAGVLLELSRWPDVAGLGRDSRFQRLLGTHNR